LTERPRKILELGTGTGAGAFILARRFPNADIQAVDLSRTMILLAQEKAPAELRSRVHFTAADAASLPHESATFDLVCQLNLPLFASEIQRVLRPGGHVVIASTFGPSTPYHTPQRVLRRRFERLGVEMVCSGRAGRGTYFIARRRPS
jgi:malonyl-CoA O-methyltransferase